MNIFWKNCNENNLDVFEKWIEKDNDFNALEFAISVLTFRMKEKMTKVQKSQKQIKLSDLLFLKFSKWASSSSSWFSLRL